jgi:hypothetical protein
MIPLSLWLNLLAMLRQNMGVEGGEKRRGGRVKAVAPEGYDEFLGVRGARWECGLWFLLGLQS